MNIMKYIVLFSWCYVSIGAMELSISPSEIVPLSEEITKSIHLQPPLSHVFSELFHNKNKKTPTTCTPDGFKEVDEYKRICNQALKDTKNNLCKEILIKHMLWALHFNHAHMILSIPLDRREKDWINQCAQLFQNAHQARSTFATKRDLGMFYLLDPERMKEGLALIDEYITDYVEVMPAFSLLENDHKALKKISNLLGCITKEVSIHHNDIKLLKSAYYTLGRCLLFRFITDLDIVVSIKPGFDKQFEGKLNQSVMCLIRGEDQIEDWLAIAQKAFQLAFNYGEQAALFYLGILQYLQNNVDQAEDYFNQLCEHPSENPMLTQKKSIAWGMRGIIAFKSNRECFEQCQRAIELATDKNNLFKCCSGYISDELSREMCTYLTSLYVKDQTEELLATIYFFGHVLMLNRDVSVKKIGCQALERDAKQAYYPALIDIITDMSSHFSIDLIAYSMYTLIRGDNIQDDLKLDLSKALRIYAQKGHLIAQLYDLCANMNDEQPINANLGVLQKMFDLYQEPTDLTILLEKNSGLLKKTSRNILSMIEKIDHPMARIFLARIYFDAMQDDTINCDLFNEYRRKVENNLGNALKILINQNNKNIKVWLAWYGYVCDGIGTLIKGRFPSITKPFKYYAKALVFDHSHATYALGCLFVQQKVTLEDFKKFYRLEGKITADKIKRIGIYLLKKFISYPVHQSLKKDQEDAKKLLLKVEQKCLKHKDELCYCGLPDKEIQEILKLMHKRVINIIGNPPSKKKTIKNIKDAHQDDEITIIASKNAQNKKVFGTILEAMNVSGLFNSQLDQIRIKEISNQMNENLTPLNKIHRLIDYLLATKDITPVIAMEYTAEIYSFATSEGQAEYTNLLQLYEQFVVQAEKKNNNCAQHLHKYFSMLPDREQVVVSDKEVDIDVLNMALAKAYWREGITTTKHQIILYDNFKEAFKIAGLDPFFWKECLLMCDEKQLHFLNSYVQLIKKKSEAHKPTPDEIAACYCFGIVLSYSSDRALAHMGRSGVLFAADHNFESALWYLSTLTEVTQDSWYAPERVCASCVILINQYFNDPTKQNSINDLMNTLLNFSRQGYLYAQFAYIKALILYNKEDQAVTKIDEFLKSLIPVFVNYKIILHLEEDANLGIIISNNEKIFNILKTLAKKGNCGAQLFLLQACFFKEYQALRDKKNDKKAIGLGLSAARNSDKEKYSTLFLSDFMKEIEADKEPLCQRYIGYLCYIVALNEKKQQGYKSADFIYWLFQSHSYQYPTASIHYAKYLLSDAPHLEMLQKFNPTFKDIKSCKSQGIALMRQLLMITLIGKQMALLYVVIKELALYYEKNNQLSELQKIKQQAIALEIDLERAMKEKTEDTVIFDMSCLDEALDESEQEQGGIWQLKSPEASIQ